MRQVAREPGVNHEPLRNWVRTADHAQVEAVDTTAPVELRALHARVTELELEKDVVRKTATYFALVPG